MSLLLSSYAYQNTRVVQLVDPTPSAVVGNYLVFKMAADPATDTAWRDWLVEKGFYSFDTTTGIGSWIRPMKKDTVPLPTGGVFGEAVLGRYNSAEKIDLTRFCNWQDSPTPSQAPEISPVQLGSRATVEPLEAGSFSQPLINMVNPPSIPDPQGLGAIMSAISNGNLFRDMSGLSATIGLAQSALSAASQGSRRAAAQASQNLATAAQSARDMLAQLQALSNENRPPAAPETVTNMGGVLGEAKKLDKLDDENAQTQGKGTNTPNTKRQDKVLGTTDSQRDREKAETAARPMNINPARCVNFNVSRSNTSNDRIPCFVEPFVTDLESREERLPSISKEFYYSDTLLPPYFYVPFAPGIWNIGARMELAVAPAMQKIVVPGVENVPAFEVEYNRKIRHFNLSR